MGKLKGLSGNRNNENAGNLLKEIENIEIYKIEFIPFEKIKRNPKNDYPIIQETIEWLKKSIMSPTGLINNLDVVPLDDGDYELLSGEHRLTAIQQLKQEGNRIFENGIPCKVYSKDMNELDREIILLEANEIKREETPERTRKMTKRLEELYQKKDFTSREITKAIAEKMNVGERQIQRYRTINNNLIPDLVQVLDDAKITLESAAQIAGLSEDMQLIVAQFIKSGEAIKKNEITLLQRQLKEKELETKKLQEDMNLLEKSVFQKNQTFLKLKEEIEMKETSIDVMQSRLDEIENEKEELKNNIPEDKLRELDQKIKRIKKEKEESQNQYKVLLEEKKKSEEEVKRLNKEIETISKRNNESQESETQNELDRIKKDYEFSLLAEDALSIIKRLCDKANNYKILYGILPKDYQSIVEEIIKKVQ